MVHHMVRRKDTITTAVEVDILQVYDSTVFPTLRGTQLGLYWQELQWCAQHMK